MQTHESGLEPPELGADQMAHPLFLQMAALAALEGKQIADANDLLRETLAHEKRCWYRAVDELGLERALQGRLEPLAGIALDVAIEIGDPVGAVLAEVVKSDGSASLAEKLMERSPEQTVALRELGVVTTEIVLRWRKSTWREPSEDQRVEIARLANNLGARLSALGRHEDALEATGEAVEKLSPYFGRFPDAFAGWMRTMVSNYLKRAQETHQQPDRELLASILDLLDKLESPSN